MSDFNLTKLNEKIEQESSFVQPLLGGISEVIVGQKEIVEKLIIGLLSNGHILLEGVPGLAKTTLVKVVAQLIDTKFQRIQFTPDMLPADLLGTLIYNQSNGEFEMKKVPSLPILFWQMRLTVLRQKYKVPSLKRCRNVR